MGSILRRVSIAVAVTALAVASTLAHAQQAKTVGGLVINFGLMPAELAVGAAGHRDAHPAHPPPGSQHVLVTLDDQKTGKRIGDAEVAIEVTDPRGRVEKKPLLHTQAGGLPDYSELFEFGWSGQYVLRVLVTLKPGAAPIEARFSVNHAI
jgi:hypothetical protein